jgi:hypothetical protein
MFSCQRIVLWFLLLIKHHIVLPLILLLNLALQLLTSAVCGNDPMVVVGNKGSCNAFAALLYGC